MTSAVVRKLRKTAQELREEINLRLRVAGCSCAVGLPHPVRKAFTIGRNWDVAPPEDCRDAALKVIRTVGNDFDCRDCKRLSAAASPREPAVF